MSTTGHNGYLGDRGNQGAAFERAPQPVNPIQEINSLERRRRLGWKVTKIAGFVSGVGALLATIGGMGYMSVRSDELEARDTKALPGVLRADGFTFENTLDKSIGDDWANIVIGMEGPIDGSGCKVKVAVELERNADGAITDVKNYSIFGHAFPNVTQRRNNATQQFEQKVVGPESATQFQNFAHFQALTEPLHLTPCGYIMEHSSVNGVRDN